MTELQICSLNDEYIIEESKPLILAKKMPYSLAQFKLLNTYLSLINPRDPSTVTRVFKLKDYLDLLGVERMNMESLANNLSGLMSIQITVPFKGYKDGFMITNLFETATVIRDEEYGWIIEMKCCDKARKLLFNIQELNYIKYILKNVIFLNSVYSMLLYQYIRYNLYRGTWEESVSALRKEYLKAAKPTYSNFMKFNEFILKPCIEEINNKTDVSVKYNTVFVNGVVRNIRFNAYEKGTLIPCDIVKDRNNTDISELLM